MNFTEDTDFSYIIEEVYTPCGLEISNLIPDRESWAYMACSFQLNGFKIIGRRARVTPIKVGQFVTLWKRGLNGITTPFEHSDKIDFFVIHTRKGIHFGQFVFPKRVLVEKGIVSQLKKEGKRGFRIYPPWDSPTNKTAQKSQEWQLKYFVPMISNFLTDLNRVKLLYSK